MSKRVCLLIGYCTRDKRSIGVAIHAMYRNARALHVVECMQSNIDGEQPSCVPTSHSPCVWQFVS